MDDLFNTPFFFIVGRPRSGTTLLRTLFDASPNVCIPPECQFIINLYPKYGKLSRWTEKELLGFYQDLQTQWLFKTWNIDHNHLKSTLLNLTGEISYNEVCKKVYLCYQSVFEKEDIQFFGDKNPGYTIYTERLMRIFPNATFIHIIRDYRDHFVSVRNVDFELPMVSLVVFKWRLFVKKFRKMMEKYPDNHLEILYEDLVRDPEQQMKKLCAFTTVPFSPEIFNFHTKEEETRKIYPSKLLEKFHSNLFKKINPDKIGVYKKQLTESEIRIADFAAGKYAEMAGYQRDFQKPTPAVLIRALPGIALAKTLQILSLVVDRFPYRLRELILSKWPLMVAKFYLSIFDPKKLTGLTDYEKEQ